MDKVIAYVKKVPLLLAAAAIGIALISLRMFRLYDVLPAAFQRLSLAAVMAGFLYLISGSKTFERSLRQTGYVVSTLRPILIYSALMGAARLFMYYSADGWSFAEGWMGELAACFLLMASVGLFEELMCRAVLCDALIYQFRNFKGVFVLTGIVVSLVFGWLHVAGTPIHTPLMLAQAVLKTASTGMIGLSLLMMYWKTRDVAACAIVHALFDFLVACPAVLYGRWDLRQVGTYVLEGNEGALVAAVLLVDFVIELVIAILVWRKVMGTIDFEEMRREW